MKLDAASISFEPSFALFVQIVTRPVVDDEEYFPPAMANELLEKEQKRSARKFRGHGPVKFGLLLER